MHPKLSRQLWRMAVRLHDAYRQRAPSIWEPRLPDLTWDECRFVKRQIERAERHGYRGAARELQEQLKSELQYLSRQCDQELQRLIQLWPKRPRLLPSLRLLYEELLALHEEFETVNCDLNSQTISVQTEPIVLEDIYLGPFEIVLNLRKLDAADPFEVNALDPHPAASCSCTTHPHVHAGRLCTGEGWDIVHSALEDGRLSELFLIVRQILRTYNPESPHIPLEDWSGVPCHECGLTMDDDDSHCCQGCYCSLCCECSGSCEICSDTRCQDCLDHCACCELSACPGCLQECRRCGGTICGDCVSPDSICNTCLEKEFGDTEQSDEVGAEETTVESEERTVSAEAAHAAVHADGLGQVAVPA